MIFSIPSGNAIDKLKWFIYLTNEFGAPSEDNIELFIENFGKIIMNGNFKINSNVEKHLTELWSEITSDKNVETVQSGGIDFYTKLSTTKFASEQDIIDFIISYRQTEEFENTISINTETTKINKETFIGRKRQYRSEVLQSNKNIVTLSIPKTITADLNIETLEVLVTYCDIKKLTFNQYKSFEELTFDYILEYFSIIGESDELTQETLDKFNELMKQWRVYNTKTSLEQLYKED